MNKFSEAKELFIDNLDCLRFINLDKSKVAYHKIISSLDKPLKMILFYGKPGSGKTFLLKKVYVDNATKDHKLIYFEQPFYTEETFFSALYESIFNEKKELKTYEEFLENYKNSSPNWEENRRENAYKIMLDEAQMYPELLIEKIRLLSDTLMFKFLFTVHKTVAQEDILAQGHFSTRIWEKIELSESSQAEIQMYVERKLQSLKNELDKYFFSKKDYKFIYQVSKGNLRTVNMLLYKAFEIYEFYEQENFSEFKNPKINEKVLEMAALDKGLIHA